ncbi:hypothetical protein COU01_00240 [Candidatus Falkowbacteria bacterium CG10_big_fil_rev_8_21_14_0_10_44_15]|uniref:Uncharacterized protein n=1 Tax=Candidatus Falkowbacteria bacterium CG10_big_fil_rev_8_21_14_0_10_44_15 TaxID=1974569 RepID=A0A2H0V0S1_9BACT|nr:MAG: hypothetical protein COU01_00240 [Candidatus Falkowbacteria bacterium CG10_big_fil_rev_8_21_14_0_10_44_15]
MTVKQTCCIIIFNDIQVINNYKFMTLTPEQFNILATKDDLKDLKREITEELGDKIDKVLTAVDSLAKKHETFEQELTANIGAHDRFQADITKLKVHTGLKA